MTFNGFNYFLFWGFEIKEKGKEEKVWFFPIEYFSLLHEHIFGK